MVKENLPSVEVHVKNYARVKNTGNVIGLQTRIIINNPIGNSEIFNFEYQKQAIEFVKKRFGEYRDGNFKYVNLFNKYGDRGYKW